MEDEVKSIEETYKEGFEKGLSKEQLDSMLDKRIQARDLLNALNELDKDKNKFTLQEFEKYLPLYQNHGTINRFTDKEKELIALSNEFMFAIDPYKEIHVEIPGMDDIVLPPPLKRIGLIKGNQATAITEFNMRGSLDERPDYSVPATLNLINALISSHGMTKEQIEEERRKIKEMETIALQKAGVLPEENNKKNNDKTTDENSTKDEPNDLDASKMLFDFDD